MINKLIITIITFFVFVFASFWTFNHINTWLGVALGITTLIVLFKTIEKEIKNEKKS